ncbi:MAG: hypothetical protein GY803_05540 [Chloroflexi bacterium]|nr:hypothetical protein [Chloroflexota bacterium]
MKRFLFYLIWLILALSLFFNIERLDINQENRINMQSFVYMLVTVATVFILVVPIFSRVRAVWTIGLWMFAYLSIKILLMENGSFWGGVNTYLTITEAFFVVGITAIAHQLARGMNVFRHAVEQITFLLSGQSLRDIERASDDIHREMTRSRHYNRPMSVIVLDPKGQSFESKIDDMITEIQHETAVQYAKAKIAQDLRKQLRLMDMVLLDKKNQQFVIVCPEVNVDGTKSVITKITNQLRQMGIDAQLSSATFPDEGLTFASLMDEARQKMKPSRIVS